MDARFEREWAEGISVYDDLAYAIERAVKLRLQLGRYVIAVEVPENAGFDVAQTTRDPRHYTLYASAERLVGMVQKPATEVIGE